jgi:hypothetical protein
VVALAEIKRPIFFTGENPGMTLYLPGTEQVTAAVSYWHCTDSPWGVGQALILWVGTGMPPATNVGCGGIFTDNLDLAHALVERLTRHFPEFQELPVETLPYLPAQVEHTYDGARYRVNCQAPAARIELEWVEVLDRKQVIWPGFPAGKAAYDLTTVICPCRVGRIQINGEFIAGDVQTAQSAEGLFASSAFLAFAETWVGPLDGNKAAAQ